MGREGTKEKMKLSFHNQGQDFFLFQAGLLEYYSIIIGESNHHWTGLVECILQHGEKSLLLILCNGVSQIS